jgi:Raf kinase inhibitor-like YbhB/YbcL family protein
MPGDATWRGRATGRPRRATAGALLAPVAALLLAVSACGATDDGQTLRTPSADQTTTTGAASAPGPDDGVDAGSAEGDGSGAEVTSEPLRLTSPSIAEGGEFPVDSTCWGTDTSPPLAWTGVPEGTVELAVVVRDVDADGFVHWVVAGIAPTTGGIAEATPPEGSVEATNDFGRAGWAGPCPSEGTHNYYFGLFALAEPSGVTPGQAGSEAATQIEQTPALMSAALSASATTT